jgi:hypothetical protein
MTEWDNDPRHLEIMTGWVRRIVDDVAKQLADDIVARVGKIFLDAKASNYEMTYLNRQRFEALEAAIAELRSQSR